MDLEQTDEHRMLAETARSFVERACPSDVVRAIERSERGFLDEHWRTLSDLGFVGLLIPAEYGGGGRGVFDLVVLAEQLGRGPLPSPLVASGVLGALPIVLVGSEELRQRWLPKLAQGTAIATVGLLEPGARDEWAEPRLRLHVARGVARLSGTKILVPFASSCDIVLVTARTDDGTNIVVVDPKQAAVTIRRQEDGGGEPVYEVSFDDAVADAAEIIATPDTAPALLDRMLDRASVVALASVIGGAERALELSVEHAKTREQFGQPIGAFQAVAHRCVDMLTDLDACRMLCYQAAAALDAERVADLELGAAQGYATEALRRIYINAHQVHGAIGFSMEHDLQLYSRRAKVFELSYGGATRHRERVAGFMGLTPGTISG